MAKLVVSEQVVTVPANATAADLINQAERAINPTYLNPVLRSTDFIVDEFGRIYEVVEWAPGHAVMTEEARRQIREVDPANPFGGNTAAHLVWVTLNRPSGWHATIPEDDRLMIREDGYRCALCYSCGGERRDLHLIDVDSPWDPTTVFVGYREVKR